MNPAHEQISLQEARARIENFCAYQERCTSEVLGRLERWGIGTDDQQWIINDLRKEGFLSDERFTELFVRSKMNQKKWGRIKIHSELIRRRIPSEIIQQEMQKIDKEQYRQNLEDLLQKKLKEIKTNDREHRSIKLKQYLYSKGYEPELIVQLIDKY